MPSYTSSLVGLSSATTTVSVSDSIIFLSLAVSSCFDSSSSLSLTAKSARRQTPTFFSSFVLKPPDTMRKSAVNCSVKQKFMAGSSSDVTPKGTL